jgi:hypothetical protein
MPPAGQFKTYGWIGILHSTDSYKTGLPQDEKLDRFTDVILDRIDLICKRYFKGESKLSPYFSKNSLSSS